MRLGLEATVVEHLRREAHRCRVQPPGRLEEQAQVGRAWSSRRPAGARARTARRPVDGRPGGLLELLRVAQEHDEPRAPGDGQRRWRATSGPPRPRTARRPRRPVLARPEPGGAGRRHGRVPRRGRLGPRRCPWRWSPRRRRTRRPRAGLLDERTVTPASSRRLDDLVEQVADDLVAVGGDADPLAVARAPRSCARRLYVLPDRRALDGEDGLVEGGAEAQAGVELASPAGRSARQSPGRHAVDGAAAGRARPVGAGRRRCRGPRPTRRGAGALALAVGAVVDGGDERRWGAALLAAALEVHRAARCRRWRSRCRESCPWRDPRPARPTLIRSPGGGTDSGTATFSCRADRPSNSSPASGSLASMRSASVRSS